MHDFFMMGGYAGYVWSSYALAALVLGFNAIAPPRAERATLAHLARALEADSDHDT